ncbi:ATP synthase subunit d, mitochondrial-like [Agrilus planipennis]|uniref:ATP synthase subunit d, mitochondrial n=1 Tax=Agrilus planipennis TaxID=224129 RepID=A0A1W4W7S2_AGRPL|nr:ATP synthase subunit d, mitochondrial-like [Agrilus planipennis]
MALKRIKLKMIDFERLAALCPPHQIAQFNKFKAKTEDYINSVLQLPEEKPPIEWDNYETQVKIPGMVADFKKQYEQLDIPYPDDTFSHLVDQQEERVKAEIVELKKASNENIETIKKRLEVLNAMPPVEEMTLEEFRDYYPDVALDPINKPTFWPHEPEDQPGYVEPDAKKEDAH